MRHDAVSPSYTEKAKRAGVGVTGVELAYFTEDVDGLLAVTDDLDDALFSWEDWEGTLILAPYRPDSIMVAGTPDPTPTVVPVSDMLADYTPGLDLLTPHETRASVASYMASLPEKDWDLTGTLVEARASVASYLASV